MDNNKCDTMEIKLVSEHGSYESVYNNVYKPLLDYARIFFPEIFYNYEKGLFYMREHKNFYYKSDIVSMTAKCIYEIAPHNDPVDMDKIIHHVISNVDEKSITPTSLSSHIYMTTKEFEEWFKDMIMSCQEYRNLNLSPKERRAGISVDDPHRYEHKLPKLENEDDEKADNDFMDPDAAIQNILSGMNKSMQSNDCFLCNRIDTEFCDTCSLNPKYKNNYESVCCPFEYHKFKQWCSEECAFGHVICCSDCELTDCEYKCNESCDECEKRVINKNYKENEDN